MTPASGTQSRPAPAVAKHWRARLSAAALTAAVMIGPALAIQPVEPGQARAPKLSRPFLAPELQVQPDLEIGIELAPGRYAPLKTGAASFLQRAGGNWEVRWDRRSDRPNLVQGSGIPLIPGAGNTLGAADIGLSAGTAPDLATVEARLRDFIAANEDLLRVDGMEFRLDPESSAPYGDGNSHWFIEFAQYANGVRVDRAQLLFRISHGNIVQFGEELVAPVVIDTRPSITRADAFNVAWRQLAFPAGTEVVETVEAGELLLLPTAQSGDVVADLYTGPTGAGYSHRLAWRFVFRVNDDDSTYEVLLDAHTGSIIEVRDLTVNADALVSGGIYPTTNTDTEVVKPMPFVAVTNGSAKITDVLGIYDYSGGTATVTLDGKYFRMSDNCGAISLSNASNGVLALGTSAGTDCTTPGVGGAGNTHASRTGFYHLTNINRKAVTFHPGNSWLASKVTANMNVDDTCNASWNGTSLNFYKSGDGCSNTGEIAAVFLHEWGHGMDTNTGGAASENGSGEAVGDTFAFLETKDACIGKNFQPGVPCYNCDSSCTGVRDVNAFSTHGAATIAKPSTITTTTGAACARWSCPYLRAGIFPYQGPMGYEGHCESYIASAANWDLTQSLIQTHGPTQGWHEMDRIWYGSLVPSKSAYRVASGGKCNVNAQVDGCGANNWYTVFLAADDDDGNLANGTPNACRIWDAFDAHGIACGARPACSGGGGSTYTVGGNVGGATGPVSLKLNGGADLVAGNGAFTFPTALADGSAYAVTVSTAPAGQSCTVGNGSGTIAGADVTNVAVTCATQATYTVGGNISGATGSVSLKLNGGADLVAGNGAFAFPAALTSGSAYVVTVSAAPAGQSCTVGNGSGTIAGANVDNVTIACAAIPPQSHTVGGRVRGLTEPGLVLQLNGGPLVTMNANGTYAFYPGIAEGVAYEVTVQTQPGSLSCTVANASGTMGAVNVTNADVDCAASIDDTIFADGFDLAPQ